MLYVRNDSAWNFVGWALTPISGSVPPAYTPAPGQSRLVVNAADEVYYWNGSAWVLVGGDGDGLYSGSGTISDSTLASVTGLLGFNTGSSGYVLVGDYDNLGLYGNYGYMDGNTSFFGNSDYKMEVAPYDDRVGLYSPVGQFEFQGVGGPGVLTIGSAASGFLVNDLRGTKKGIEYSADYSSGFSSRSLVDKAYVDAAVGGAGDDWGAQVAAVSARLTGDGTVGHPLDIAQQGAAAGQTLKWNGVSAWVPGDDNEGVTGSGSSGRVASWNGSTSITSSADFRHDIGGNMVYMDDTLWTSKLIRSNVPTAWRGRLANRPDAGINAQHTLSDPIAVTNMSLAYGSLNVGNTTSSGLPTAAPNIRLYRARMSGSDAVPSEVGDPLGFVGFQVHRGQSTSLESMYDLTNGGMIIGAYVDTVASDGTVGNRTSLMTKDVGGGAAPFHNERLTVDRVGRVGIGTITPSVGLDVNWTDAVRLARGTTAQRPATGLAGMVRFNTDSTAFEGHDGTDWAVFGSGGGGGGGDDWGSQVAAVSARLSGDGTVGTPLDLAQQGASAGEVLKWSGSAWVPGSGGHPPPPSTETIEATDFTATAGVFHTVNSGSVVVVDPPGSPVIGMEFGVSDATGGAKSNNIEIAFGAQKYGGAAQSYFINCNYCSAVFVYVGTTTGWVCKNK